jgi:hypothetical protein
MAVLEGWTTATILGISITLPNWVWFILMNGLALLLTPLAPIITPLIEILGELGII